MWPVQTTQAVSVDFTSLVWFNWVCIFFHLNDDEALDEVTGTIVIHCKVIEVPSFEEGLEN